MSYKTRKRFKLTVSYIVLLMIAVICLYPAIWVLFSSFRPGSSLYSESFIPKKFTVDHYRELFASKSFMYGTWYFNTLKIAVLSTIFGTILVTLNAYSLSRFRFKGRKTVMTSMLILNMFPGFLTMIALYILFRQVNLLDTHAALIAIYSIGTVVLSNFVAKGFFDTIPKSLEDSARIDGASHLKVFTSIMLPLSRPILIYLSLTTFVGSWVDFLLARMILRSKEKWTVAVGLWDMVNNYQNSNFTMFAAGSVMIAVPIGILFLYMQRYFVDGLTAGANKG